MMVGERCLALVAATWVMILAAASGHAEEESQQQSEPDRIVLRNGSVLFGTVTDVAEGKVSLETDFAGTVELDQAQIVEMTVRTEHALQLADGRVLGAVPIEVREGELILPGEPASLADLERIDPEPWELGKGYDWTGTASFALTVEQGNTDTEEADYRLNTRLTGLEDRHTAGVRRDRSSQRRQEHLGLDCHGQVRPVPGRGLVLGRFGQAGARSIRRSQPQKLSR